VDKQTTAETPAEALAKGIARLAAHKRSYTARTVTCECHGTARDAS
jgi:hypothetical protein